MPLSVGNRWVAQVRETNIVGEETFFFDTTDIMPEGSVFRDRSGMTWWNGSDRLYRRDWNCGAAMRLHPVERGDSYATTPPAQVIIPDPSGGEPQITEQKTCQVVVSTDTLITVPAGSCRWYHYTGRIIAPAEANFIRPEHRFFAPGVGPVLIEQRNPRGQVVDRRHLTDYTIMEG